MVVMEGEGGGKTVKNDVASSSSLAPDGAFFDDLLGTGSSSSGARRFQPKFKPRPIRPGSVKPEPNLDDISGKPESSVTADDSSSPMDVDYPPAAGQQAARSRKRVVREVDVFFNPSPIEPNSLIYITQYPLRPCWRPYNLDGRFEEVRVKPNQTKLEMDVAIDVDSENYDSVVEDLRRMEKMTSSSSKAPFLTGYAVGYLIGKRLHLNPINAVVQLRPSMAYLNDSQDLMTTNETSKNEKTEPSTSSTIAKKDDSRPDHTENGRPLCYAHVKKEEDSEAWISLRYLPSNSPSSYRYRQKLVSQEISPTHFVMNVDAYITSLVQGRLTSSIHGKTSYDSATNRIIVRNVI